jgi:RNA polymerase sigma-70 factor (ECF subfamily)
MDSTAESDEAFMMRFQAGDRTALTTLVRRHNRSIYNFILRQVRSRPVAEDLTQDVFVRVVQRATTFKHEARFTSWLYAIARNLCVDHLRRGGVRHTTSLDAPLGRDDGASGATLSERLADTAPSASAERSVVSADIGARVHRAVEALPVEQREVFLLRQLARVPFHDIAEMTGVSENTVKSRMRYALERLQEALADYEELARALR